MSFEVMAEDWMRRVQLGLEDIRSGKMVILTDDEDRENEGDLTMAADAVMLHDILIILSQPLSPQSLLRLSAGSRTLHRCATCDDVRVVFMHVSLLADSLPFSAPSSSVVEGRALADIGLDCHGRTVLC